MSEIANHSLFNDFPDSREIIHQLKQSDPEFARKAAEYHELDHQVRGLEMRSIPTTDEVFESLKRQRMYLKDELYAMIKREEDKMH